MNESVCKAAVKIEFTVPGQPVAKQRPKFARIGSFVKTYTPKETVNYESLVRLAAAQAMNGADPMEGPLTLQVEIHLTIPTSTSKKQQALMAQGCVLPTKRPDCDNIGKAVLDALNGVAWRDDAQVVDLRFRKRYSLTPGIRVTVDLLQDAVPAFAPMPEQIEIDIVTGTIESPTRAQVLAHDNALMMTAKDPF